MPTIKNINLFQALQSTEEQPPESSLANEATEEVRTSCDNENTRSSNLSYAHLKIVDDTEGWVEVQAKKPKSRKKPLQKLKGEPKSKSKKDAAAKVFPAVPENVKYAPLTAEGLDAWFQQCPKMKWCYENKDVIISLHSSSQQSKKFPQQCTDCKRFYQSCMFALWDQACCKWCNTAKGMGCWDDQFDIHRHIHCNKLGPKVCGQHMELASAQGLNAIKPKGLEFAVKTKMSQKERKQLEREEKEKLEG